DERFGIPGHIRDARGPRFERTHAEDVEQPVDEGLAHGRFLVGPAPETLRKIAVGLVAAVRADLHGLHAAEDRTFHRLGVAEPELQLRKAALRFALARAAAHREFDTVDRDVLAGRRILI